MHPPVRQTNPPSGDIDRELARLLAEHHGAEAAEYRDHVRTCLCCQAHARMFAALRSDLWAIVERRDPWAA
jgi:hypothetical protein